MSSQSIEKEVSFLDDVDSTNQYGKHLARKGGREGTVIVAARQSEGKGRLNRVFYPREGWMIFLSDPII